MKEKKKKSFKRNLLETGIIIAIFGTLYLTGLHTEVIGFLQRGILATGLMNPNLENQGNLAQNAFYPEADFNLHLVNSEGEKVAMKDLKGKVIFMNLWATWCPPCIAEMPGINKLYNKVDSQKVAFIMLSLDRDFQKAIDYNEKKGYDFEIYKLEGRMPQMYQSQSIPSTFVINAEGKLVMTHQGMGDYNTRKFRRFIEAQY